LSADAVGRFAPNDGKAMGTYIERYVYDAVGNFLEMQHRGSDPANSGWTRSYSYGETSQLEDGMGGAPLKTSNRLTSTTVGTTTATYSTAGDGYDSHGNMLKMPHLPQMAWDYRDQLQRTDLGGGGTAYYVYDAAGQRVRKVWEKSASLVEERIYLGGFEIFRRRNGTGAVTLERETLHIMDDKQRIALVETRTLDTAGSDPAPQQLIRYQLSNHLGSTSLELDDRAQIISYEEYTPYGSTSYQAVRSQTDTPKRYRYTGKERDEETGLNYHGARYYAPWLGDGANLYAFVQGNPIEFNDPNGMQSAKPGTVDYQIMTMTDPQLYAHLKGLSMTARASFGESATGKFATRAWAMVKKYKMPLGYPPPAVTTKRRGWVVYDGVLLPDGALLSPKRPVFNGVVLPVETPPKPFHPVTGFNRWLLYSKHSPILDYLTNDKNLKAAQEAAQDASLFLPTLFGSFATGGIVADLLVGAGLESGAAGVAGGIAAGGFKVYSKIVYAEGGLAPMPTLKESLISIESSAITGGVMAKTGLDELDTMPKLWVDYNLDKTIEMLMDSMPDKKADGLLGSDEFQRLRYPASSTEDAQKIHNLLFPSAARQPYEKDNFSFAGRRSSALTLAFP